MSLKDKTYNSQLIARCSKFANCYYSIIFTKNQREMTKITIEITDPKGLKLLENLEGLNILRIIKNEEKKPFDAKQFRGILSKDEADGFRKHIQKIRNEWEQSI